MSYQYIEKIENLNNVVFIAAWSGWSDAAESATKSLKEIINQTKAKKFASIDPEDYFRFSETNLQPLNLQLGSISPPYGTDNNFFFIIFSNSFILKPV